MELFSIRIQRTFQLVSTHVVLNVVVKGCLNNFQASFFTFYVNHLFIYFVALLA
jgi:hypothetical protein